MMHEPNRETGKGAADRRMSFPRRRPRRPPAVERRLAPHLLPVRSLRVTYQACSP